MSKVSEFCRMRHRSIMTNSPYYRSANKTIQISRSQKHIQVRLPDKNNHYLFMNLSANFQVSQDFLPVRTEKTFIWPTIRRNSPVDIQKTQNKFCTNKQHNIFKVPCISINQCKCYSILPWGKIFMSR